MPMPASEHASPPPGGNKRTSENSKVVPSPAAAPSSPASKRAKLDPCPKEVLAEQAVVGAGAQQQPRPASQLNDQPPNAGKIGKTETGGKIDRSEEQVEVPLSKVDGKKDHHKLVVKDAKQLVIKDRLGKEKKPDKNPHSEIMWYG